jgi:hypothetical protein
MTPGAGSNCPENYVKVAANANLGTSEFCVAKYEMKNIGSVANSQASGTPWVNIPRDTSSGVTGAIARCQALGGNSDLISNAQWQAMAREIETVQSPVGTYLNWSNNSTSGNNYINRGNSYPWPGFIRAASTDNDPCSGTGLSNCAANSHSDFIQKRTHTLKSGETIWDVAGNVWEWVKDNNTSEQGGDGYVFQEWGWNATLKLKYGPEGTYTSKNWPAYGGLGWAALNYNHGGVVRGGSVKSFDSDNDAFMSGVFATALYYFPSGTWASIEDVGFRCVFLPSSAPAAPSSIAGTAGNAQVSLTWSAPLMARGSAITDYEIQYSSNSGSTWTTFSDGISTNTNALVTGLTNGTPYVFRVAATNAVGIGSYAAASGSFTPVAGATVTGGTVTAPGDGYTYLTFTTNGTLVISGASLTADVLVVGGGGGTGQYYNSGGGGGGVRLTNSRSLAPGSYAVVVGTGVIGSSGGQSSIDGLVATGGSGGGAGPYGYGGGTGGTSGTPTSASNSTGNAGGSGTVNGDDSDGGGGGGAGGNGTSATNTGGLGGSGMTVWGTEYGRGGNGERRGGTITANRGMGASKDSGLIGSSGVVVIRYLTPGATQ